MNEIEELKAEIASLKAKLADAKSTSNFDDSLISERDEIIRGLQAELNKYRRKCEACGGSGTINIPKVKGAKQPQKDILGNPTGFPVIGARIDISDCKQASCPHCNGTGYTDVVLVPSIFVEKLLWLWHQEEDVDYKAMMKSGEIDYYYDHDAFGQDKGGCLFKFIRLDADWWELEAAK